VPQLNQPAVHPPTVSKLVASSKQWVVAAAGCGAEAYGDKKAGKYGTDRRKAHPTTGWFPAIRTIEFSLGSSRLISHELAVKEAQLN
jgi:hypothetical protein